MDKHRIEPSRSPDDTPIPLEARDEPAPAPAPRARPIAPAVAPGEKKKAQDGPKCPHCGYSVAGLASSVCPECGKNWIAGTLSRSRREEADRGMRREYMIAVGLLVAGLAAMAVGIAVAHDIAFFPWYLLSYVVAVPIGILGFYICSWIWIGFDAPFMLTAIRLTAIYAVVDAAGFFLGLIPVVGWIGPIVIYLGLLMKLLDLEFADAAIVAVVTFLLRLMIGFAVLAMFT